MMQSPRGGLLLLTALFGFFTLCMVGAGLWANSFSMRPPTVVVHKVKAAGDLPRHGAFMNLDHRTYAPLNRFGTYGDHYYYRRWAKMCNGPARYDAMREAYELGKPNPC